MFLWPAAIHREERKAREGRKILFFVPLAVFAVFKQLPMLTLCGLYNLGFAVFHLLFWKIFKWKEDLASLTHINRSVMQILNLRLTYVFLVMAFVLFIFPTELTATRLGQALLIALSVFWFMRAGEQVIFFGWKHRVSNAMTVLFLIGGFLHLLPLL